ncbi:hypothetical protein H6F86_11925 [Phormidium sp. FACHB-592]|uniref:Uncharacterized protein n=1 Tax=Stenomitos frigidus AS-A4 TaxID=2933935 RepID=A0ABV0KJM1_9CYAN|nr:MULTISPECIES: hypothetical protein [Cyanophyceae]MBD2037596.1 hypothetical protein [Leptolyngbya sp. FACHB-321]MBD2074582.1 hypothetical protein [Phormidium sp. FACHB-592]
MASKTAWKHLTHSLLFIPLVAICLAVGGTLFLLLVTSADSYLANNRVLSEYENDLRATEHSPNTSSVMLQSRVTRPPGNGQHCFYFVGELRRYQGTRASIQAFYNDKAQVAFVQNGKIGGVIPSGLKQLANWSTSAVDEKGLYLVYTMVGDFEHTTVLDLRCH